MRRQVGTLLASALLAAGLMLPACGGGSATQDTSSDSKAAVEEVQEKAEEVQEEKEDPAKKFVGEWKLAAAEFNGVTMAGDLSSVMGDEASFALSLSEDGTGTFSYGDEKVNLTWKLQSEDSISMELEKTDEEEDSSTPTDLTANYKDDDLSINMEVEDNSGTMVFNTTGKSKNYFEIALDDATAITSKKELVGTWKLAGMYYMGISAYGASEDLSALAGQSLDADVTFKEDGTGTYSDAEITWQASEDGASIVLGSIGDTEYKVPVKQLDDTHIILDMSDSIGMSIAFMYTK
ncbi:MAG: hypothetical protein Q4A07_02515 [Coriobacteriales bacterium]|nr:hypothetical protein [Coriobacteriales bacterium]